MSTHDAAVGQSGAFHSDAASISSAPVAADEPLPLSAFVEATNQLTRELLLGNRSEALHLAADALQHLLNAEACSIFVYADGVPGEMILEAESADKWTPRSAFQPVRLKPQSIPKAGLTAHLATSELIHSLAAAEISDSEYLSDIAPQHLAGGRYFSLLSVPLSSKRGQPLGLLIAANKKAPNGEQSPTASFSPNDEAMAQVVANFLSVFLERQSIRPLAKTVIERLRAASDLSEIVDEALKVALAVVHADRAELALWDDHLGDLVIAFQRPDNADIMTGQRVPTTSVLRAVWDGKSPLFHDDVSSQSDVVAETDRKAGSLIAVRLEWESKRIGALAVAAHSPHSFDQYDVELVQLLGQCATIGYELVGGTGRFRGIGQQLQERRLPQEELLTSILESVRDSLRDSDGGFDAGIIYIADLAERELYCAAHMGCDGLDVDPRIVLRYPLEASALCTKVFRDARGHWAAQPTDDVLDPQGVSMFRIASSLVGVPLICGNTTLGALVVWSRRSPSFAKTEHIDRLEPFARLAAAAIATGLSESHRASVLRSIQRVVSELQRGAGGKRDLLTILEGIRVAGFERVRLFEYNSDTRLFTALAWLGMDSRLPFTGHTTSPATNPYIRHLVEIALADPAAREYKPVLFGPSPEAEALGRPPYLPWALVPLVFAETIYGYIAADNAITERAITQDGLEVMTVLGALAAQAIAHTRAFAASEEATRLDARAELARRLDVLDILTPIAHVLFDTDAPLTRAHEIVRQTALTQDADISTLFVVEGRERLVLKAGVVYLRKDECLPQSHSDQLDWTITDESKARAEGLTAFVATTGLPLSIRSYGELLQHPAHGGRSDAELYPDGVDHPETGFGCMYAVPLRSSSRGEPRDTVIGVFKIERRRHRPAFTEDNRKVFDLVAAHLSLILQAIDHVQYRVFSDVAHAIGGGLSQSYTTLTMFRDIIAQLSGSEVVPFLQENIHAPIAILGRACQRLEVVLEASRDPERMVAQTLESLWRLVVAEIELKSHSSIQSTPVALEATPPLTPETQLRLPAIQFHDLVSILGNLMANAIRHSPPNHPARLHVIVRDVDGRRRLLFRVSDSGPGIPPRVLEAAERPGEADFYRLTAGNARGGTGVQRVYGLVRHNKWEITAKVAAGTEFDIVVPDFTGGCISTETA